MFKLKYVLNCQTLVDMQLWMYAMDSRRTHKQPVSEQQAITDQKYSSEV